VIHSIFGKKLWISGLVGLKAKYEGDLAIQPPTPMFEAIIETDHDAFTKKLDQRDRREFSPIDSATANLETGVSAVYVAIRDQWGNLAVLPEQTVVVAPGPALVPIVVSALLLALAICILTTAPWIEYCNQLLMNPLLRTYGSFGTLPLLISTIAPTRAHILKRYKRELSADSEIKPWSDGFVAPERKYQADQLYNLLSDRRALLI
jgi:hypothetical protein